VLGITFAGAAVLAIVFGLVGRWMPPAVLLLGTAALTVAPGVVATLRKVPRAGALIVGGLALAPLIAGSVYAFSHPQVHVDNANDTAIDVWIDGRRWQTLPPNPEATEPPRVRLPFGRHRLGWSAPFGPAPLHEIEVDVSPFGEALYSPGAAGCYWLAVTAYGGASAHGVPHGPQPLGQWLELDRVDVWFGDTPKAVRAPRVLGGTLRYALQRNAACMELAARGCDPGRRAAYVECTRSIEHAFERAESGRSECFEEAVRSCPLRTGGGPEAGK
jgi:hypothetical protein